MRTRDAGLMAVLVVAWTAPAAALDDSELPIQVRLYGITTSNVAIVQAARGPAEAVLRDAGLGPEWIDCSGSQPPPACVRPPGPDDFLIRIIGGLAEHPHACGASLRPGGPSRGHFITIFLDCVRRGAHGVQVSQTVVFAYAIVHEIGHLLLPVGHSRQGIMRGRPDRFDWIRASRGTLRFTPEQGRQLRAAMQRRALLAQTRP